MAEVHDRIGAARKDVPGDPIPHVAKGIAARSALLCFDELHVTDIADAMILGRLFRALFEAQVVVVATSNVPPGELYKNGLNRALFLPFIELIGEHMELEELLAAKDFRLDKLAGKPLYFTPADAHARAEMDRLWGELTGNHPGAPVDLDVKGRKLRVPLASMGVARFAFAELCEQPLGANDFLHIAHAFHTVLIDAIPVLAKAQRDVTRRFVNLIDTLYDSRVCLIASAAAEPQALYAAGDMRLPVRAHRLAPDRDAIGRAISRAAWTGSAHRCRPRIQGRLAAWAISAADGHERLGQAQHAFHVHLGVGKEGRELALVQKGHALHVAHGVVDRLPTRGKADVEIHQDATAHLLRQPVEERCAHVRLDGEPEVGRLHEVPGRQTAHVMGHGHHRLPIADVLDHGVGVHEVVGHVGDVAEPGGIALHRGELRQRFAWRGKPGVDARPLRPRGPRS